MIKYVEESKKDRALENVYMIARRELHRMLKNEVAERIPESRDVQVWRHVIRFCEDAGCESTILRNKSTVSDSTGNSTT